MCHIGGYSTVLVTLMNGVQGKEVGVCSGDIIMWSVDVFLFYLSALLISEACEFILIILNKQI